MAKRAKSGETLAPGEAGRKRRTREHVIADLSVNHVERLALKCGFTVQRASADYGYDLWLQTYSETGEIEEDYVSMQLKASDSLSQYELVQEEAFSYPVTTKDFRLWGEALLPVIFVLYDAQLDEAYWLDLQDYARSQQPDLGGKSVRLHIPRRHVLGVQSIRLIRLRKQQRVPDIRTRERR